jgi:aryl-alcohol dehydrogenase-like predicted oxidoreductase
MSFREGAHTLRYRPAVEVFPYGIDPRALRELGIGMIPAYSPQARGRMERNYRTWQGRFPQELRVRQIQTVEEANRFLREQYIAEFNRRFGVPAARKRSAFVRTRRKDLRWIFSIQH